MSFVRIQLKANRTPEQKEASVKEIIDVMDRLDFDSRESVRVIYKDMLPENYYRENTKKQ